MTPLLPRDSDGYTMHIDGGEIWITGPDDREVERWIIKDHSSPSAHELARARQDALNGADERDGHA